MAAMCDVANGSGRITIPWLVKFFHSFLHLDFNFDNTTAVFIPTDDSYLQALILYSGVPTVFGGLIFIAVLGYFLIWCCSRNCQCEKEGKPSPKCCVTTVVWIIYIAVLICSGSVIAAFVFNSKVDEAVKEVTTAITNVNNTLLGVQDEVIDIRLDLLHAQNTIADLEQTYYPFLPYLALEYLRELNAAIVGVINSLKPVKKVSLPEINNYIDTGEYYRWWITLGVLSLQALLCLLAFCGTVRRSKQVYVLLIVLGTICILFTWTSCGVEVAAAVAAADLCVNTEATINFYVRKSLVPEAFVNYYVECQPGSRNPYQKYADNASKHFVECLRVLNWTLEQPFPLAARDDLLSLKSDVERTETRLAVINKALNCTYVNQQYRNARCAICYPFETGISNLLLSGLVVGVLMILILCCVSPVWGRFLHWKRRRHQPVSDARVRSRMDGETPYQSISESNTNSRPSSTSSETVSLLPSAPPPEYDAIYHSGDLQFHSCEEGLQDREGVNIIIPIHPSPLPPAGASNESASRARKKRPDLGGHMSMAF